MTELEISGFAVLAMETKIRSFWEIGVATVNREEYVTVFMSAF